MVRRPTPQASGSIGARLAWDALEAIKGLYPDWAEPVGQRMTLAFECDSPAGVDTTYRKLIDAGYDSRREPWDAIWGHRYAVVLDPDRIAVDLFAELPKS